MLYIYIYVLYIYMYTIYMRPGSMLGASMSPKKLSSVFA